MSGNAWAVAGLIALALVLPVAALRGVGFERGLKMAGAWLAIFIAAMLLFGLIER